MRCGPCRLLCLGLTRGGDGRVGGGVPLGAVPALSWCGEVSLEGKDIIISQVVLTAEADDEMR